VGCKPDKKTYSITISQAIIYMTFSKKFMSFFELKLLTMWKCLKQNHLPLYSTASSQQLKFNDTIHLENKLKYYSNHIKLQRINKLITVTWLMT